MSYPYRPPCDDILYLYEAPDEIAYDYHVAIPKVAQWLAWKREGWVYKARCNDLYHAIVTEALLLGCKLEQAINGAEFWKTHPNHVIGYKIDRLEEILIWAKEFDWTNKEKSHANKQIKDVEKELEKLRQQI